jgi:hypothetical protein
MTCGRDRCVSSSEEAEEQKHQAHERADSHAASKANAVLKSISPPRLSRADVADCLAPAKTACEITRGLRAGVRLSESRADTR